MSSGSLIRTINNPAPVAFDRFGASVALSAAHVLVGAPRPPEIGAVGPGRAFLFDASDGSLIYTFDNPAPGTGDQFGHCVALSATHALIGAPFDDVGAFPVLADAGSAWLFSLATGALVHALPNPNPQSGERFGWSVALTGARALVGAERDNDQASSGGGAYLFDTATGALTDSFFNPVPSALGYFGTAVALTDDRALIGAPGVNPGMAASAGAAYLFSLDCSPVTPTPPPTPSPAAGSPSPSPTVPPCCPGDADNSGGNVNANDFLAVQASFGANNGLGGLGDANCSGGVVNANDFLAVQANFGSSCG